MTYQSYTKEIRAGAIAAALQPGISRQEAAKKFGVNVSTLDKWLRNIKKPKTARSSKRTEQRASRQALRSPFLRALFEHPGALQRVADALHISSSAVTQWRKVPPGRMPFVATIAIEYNVEPPSGTQPEPLPPRRDRSAELAEQRKPGRPKSETKIKRNCLACASVFMAETRFQRLCQNHRYGDGTHNFYV